MFDTPVRKVMKKVLHARPETLVGKAAKLMALRKVGAIMVVDEERLVGIFTERDMVFRVVARGVDAQATTLAEVMTPSPITVSPEKPFGYALVVMQENGFRHLPVIEDGKPIGMISSRNAMDPELEEFVSETRRREHWKKAARRAC